MTQADENFSTGRIINFSFIDRDKITSDLGPLPRKTGKSERSEKRGRSLPPHKQKQGRHIGLPLQSIIFLRKNNFTMPFQPLVTASVD